MNDIKVLGYKFFVGAANVGYKSNEYTGSVTLNPERHNAIDDEFKYKIFSRKVDDDFKVVAQCYVGNVSFENIDPEKISELEFEGSDEGVVQARDWLQGAYDAVMKNR